MAIKPGINGHVYFASDADRQQANQIFTCNAPDMLKLGMWTFLTQVISHISLF